MPINNYMHSEFEQSTYLSMIWCWYF